MKQRSQRIGNETGATSIVASLYPDFSLRPFFSLCAFAVNVFAETVEQR